MSSYVISFLIGFLLGIGSAICAMVVAILKDLRDIFKQWVKTV